MNCHELESRLDALREQRAAAFTTASAAAEGDPSDPAAITRADAAIRAVVELDGGISECEAQLAAARRASLATARIIDTPAAPGLPSPAAMEHARSSSPIGAALRATGLLARVAANRGVGGGELPLTIRALLGSGVAGYAVPPTGVAPVIGYYPTLARLVELLPVVPATGPSVMHNRLKLKAGEAGAEVVDEGDAKPQVEVESVPVTTPVLTFAGWEKVSVQLLSDFSGTASMIEGLLTQVVLDAIDANCYATLTTVSNFTAFTPTAGDTALESAARIATALAVKGSRNIVVGLNPTDLLTAGLVKASDSGMYLGGPVALQRPGVRVVESSSVASGKIIGLDVSGRAAQYADRESVGVQIGAPDDDFIKNLRTLLVEARGVTLIRDPGLILYGDAVSA